MHPIFIWQIIAFSFCLSGLSTSSLASTDVQKSEKDTLFIVTPAWKTFTEENGEGFYFELMKMIYEPMGISIRFQITPWARSVAMVKLKKADALLGSYIENPDQYYFPKEPIWLDISAAVFKRNNISWQSIDSLHDKKVGWIRGYNYDKYLDVSMQIIKLIDNKQAWTLLELNRIDAYIDSLTDLRLYIEEHTIDLAKYELKNILFKNMYARFAKTDKGKKFADIFDQRIPVLHKTGQLKELYLKWGYEAYYQALSNNI